MKKRICCMLFLMALLCQVIFPVCGQCVTDAGIVFTENNITGIRVVGSTSALESEKVTYTPSTGSVEYNSQTPGSVIALFDTPLSYQNGYNYCLSGTVTMTGFSAANTDPNAGLFIAYRMDTPYSNQPLLYSAVACFQDTSVQHAELYWAEAAASSMEFSKSYVCPNAYMMQTAYPFALSVTAAGYITFSLNGQTIMNAQVTDKEITPQIALIFNYATARIENIAFHVEHALTQHINGVTVYADGFINEASKVSFNTETMSLTYTSETPGVVFAALNTDVPLGEGTNYTLTGKIRQTGFAQPVQSWYSTALVYRLNPASAGVPSFYSAASLWQSGTVNQLELYWSDAVHSTWDFVENTASAQTYTVGSEMDFQLTITADRRMTFLLEDTVVFQKRLSHNDIDYRFGFLFNYSTATITDLNLEIETVDRGIDGIVVSDCSNEAERNKFTYDVPSGTLSYNSTTPATGFVTLSTCKNCETGYGYKLTGTLNTTHYLNPAETWYNTGLLYRYTPSAGQAAGVYSGYTFWQNKSVNSVELYWTNTDKSAADFLRYNPLYNICIPGQKYDFEMIVTADNKSCLYVNDQLLFEETISTNHIERNVGILFLNSAGVVSNLILSEIPVADNIVEGVETAQVLTVEGDPALYINGEKQPLLMFAQWMAAPLGNEYNNYPTYIQSTEYAGIRIYQPRAEGAIGVNTWSPYLNRILYEDPDAMFVLPIWVQSGEALQLSGAAHMDSSAPGLYSLGSLVWLEHAQQYLSDFVSDFMNSPYADHIVGFMLTAGNTGEWFDINTYQNPSPDFDRCQDNIDHFRLWLAEKYSTDAALQEAWNDSAVTINTASIPQKFISDGPMLDPLTHQNLIDFMTYDSEVVAGAIHQLCETVKDACDGTRIVGVPYGYTMETGVFNNVAGSLSFDRLLDMTDIDFICSPLSYQHRDLADYVGWHGFADSARSHGKLWISEDDTVTHLNRQTQYDWYRHINMEPEESSAMLWKNFMAAYTKRMGTWWYDNYGQGAFNSPEMMSDINLMQQLYTSTIDWEYESVTDVALVLDERSELYQTPGCYWPSGSTFNADLQGMRKYLGIAGAPVDVISLEDICSGNAREYKVYIFANAFVLDQRQRAAINGLKRDSKSLVFIKLPAIIDAETNNASLSTAEAVTGFDLRLAISDYTPPVQMGYGYVDMAGNLTEVPIANFYSDFSLTNRQHMYVQLGTGDISLLNSNNGKAIVAKSVKSAWTAYYADNMNLLSPQLLRNIYANAGVFVYSDNNRNIQADANFVSVTITDDDSTEAIFVPLANGEVYEITTGQYYPVVNYAIVLDSAKAHTYVFYLGTHGELPIQKAYDLCSIATKIYANGGKEIAIIPVNQQKNISAYLATEQNYFLNQQPVFAYSILDATVATVDANGVVTSLAKGTTKLIIRYGSLERTITIRVV